MKDTDELRAWVITNSMHDGERELPFSEIFTETLGLCILYNNVCDKFWVGLIAESCIMRQTDLLGIQVDVIVTDLK